MAVDLGGVGIWSRKDLDEELALELESLGYGAIWIGGSPPGDLELAGKLLAATRRITVATGIVNIWKDDPETVAASYHRLATAHPGRFLLGVGVGHPEAVSAYQRPYDAVVAYLDQLDQWGVPVAERALAALGPRMLRLAAERSAGAHPYLTTPTHTRRARELLGGDVLLAPEQKVVVEADPVPARAIGRQSLAPYLRLANYRKNLLRLGYTDRDLDDSGSDQLVDALAPHGDAEAVAAAVVAHLDAGADHVCIQVLGDDPRAGYRALAGALPTR